MEKSVFRTFLNIEGGWSPKSKTKCITFFRKKKEVPLRKMMLDDKPLPWVKTVTHLGVTINDKLFRGQDTMEKRAQYAAKCNELRQEFHFADPNTVAFLNDTYRALASMELHYGTFFRTNLKELLVTGTRHTGLFTVYLALHIDTL